MIFKLNIFVGVKDRQTEKNNAKCAYKVSLYVLKNVSVKYFIFLPLSYKVAKSKVLLSKNNKWKRQNTKSESTQSLRMCAK